MHIIYYTFFLYLMYTSAKKTTSLLYHIARPNIATLNIAKMNMMKPNVNLISISPAGFKGFYLMGIASYIKTHFSLENYIYSGASAGSWTALLMTYNREDLSAITNKILDKRVENTKSIKALEYTIKEQILTNFKKEDFDLHKLFIGVTTIDKFKINTPIYSNFASLEDAIDCCIASSHIPFITGSIMNKYHDIYSFDGGFSKYPYLNNIIPTLHMTPDIFSNKTIKQMPSIAEYSAMFSRDRYNFRELFDAGYTDAKNNHYFLDRTII